MSTNTNITWNDLFKAGSVVDLTVRIWRARIALRPEDLGIEPTDEVSKALSLGAQRLLPTNTFAGVLVPVHKAERMLRYYSLNFPLVRGARYVPVANMPALTEILEECIVEFNKAVNTFVRRFNEERDAMLPIIQRALQTAAKNKEAADNAYQRVVDAYPSPSEVRASFGLSYSSYAISGAASADVAGAASKETDNVRSVLGEMISDMRDDLFNQTTKIKEAIGKSGRIPPGLVERTENLLGRLESLNVLGDDVIGSQIKTVRALLSACTGDGTAPDGASKGIDSLLKELGEVKAESIAAAEASLTGLGKRRLVGVVAPPPRMKEEESEEKPEPKAKAAKKEEAPAPAPKAEPKAAKKAEPKAPAVSDEEAKREERNRKARERYAAQKAGK